MTAKRAGGASVELPSGVGVSVRLGGVDVSVGLAVKAGALGLAVDPGVMLTSVAGCSGVNVAVGAVTVGAGNGRQPASAMAHSHKDIFIRLDLKRLPFDLGKMSCCKPISLPRIPHRRCLPLLQAAPALHPG